MRQNKRITTIALLVCAILLFGQKPAAFATSSAETEIYSVHLPLILNRAAIPNIFNVTELISTLRTAAGDCSTPYTFNLATGTYTLTAVESGYNGLPVINCDVTINGNNATIQRSSTAPEFRIFEIASTGKLTLNDVTLSGGLITFRGGAIYNGNGTLIIDHGTLSGNAAIQHSGSEDSIAGAIYNGGGTVNITNSTFSGNTSNRWSGAIRNDLDGNLTVTDTNFSNNNGNASGGGIDNTSGSATITDSEFSGNLANYGGGISNHGTLTISGGAFSNNQSIVLGAGIINFNAMTVTDSSFSGNIGGAVYNDMYTTASLHNSCIMGNSPNPGKNVIDNINTTSINATDNWWGAADGPSGAGPGSGDSVSTNIVFAPFQTSILPGCPTSPFITDVQITPSGVTYQSQYYISPNQPIALSASVFGGGNYDPGVNWSIMSGGGSLSASSGNNITFTAPAALGLSVVRATSIQDPSKYAEVTIRTAIIVLRSSRTRATVLTGGSVPLWAYVSVGSDNDYEASHVAWSIISGGGSITSTPGSFVSITFTAPPAAGTTVIRASAVADPAKFTDSTITINSSGVYTCSNPPVIPSGDVGFSVSGNWGSNMPGFGSGVIGNYDALIGETQSLTVNAFVTSPATAPITSVTVYMTTDAGIGPGQSLSLISGTNLNGQWQGSWTVDDTHCNEYDMEIHATNATGTTITGLSLK